MSEDIAGIARGLAERAEAVCRRYLPAGRRERSQWRVGDVHNAPGRSLFVRLDGPTSGHGAAGRWHDAASGESGDLIDLIRAAQDLPTLAEALAEARRFLTLPATSGPRSSADRLSARYDPKASIARLVAQSLPIAGTLGETYLTHRGLIHCTDLDPLRFHPACPYRDPLTGQFAHRPALLSLVTAIDGRLTGLQRTYLSPIGTSKADVATPRRSLGAIWLHGVRFGVVDDVGVIGEGVETVLSVKCAVPTMPMVAALSADNLRAHTFPPTLRRLYIAVDRDPAGFKAANSLAARLRHDGVRIANLLPAGEDFNADLVYDGIDAVRRRVAQQMLPEDRGYLADV